MSEDLDWITKADAAGLLACDERTIERRHRAGKLNAKARPGFPTLYWRADVEKLRQTSPGEVRTGLLEAVTAPPANGNGAMATHRTRGATFEEVFLEVLQALRGALAQGTIGPTGPTHGPTGATGPTGGATSATGPTLSVEERAAQWVTLPEAAVIKGRTPTFLKRKIADGTLKAEKDRGWRIRRKDLEAL